MRDLTVPARGEPVEPRAGSRGREPGGAAEQRGGVEGDLDLDLHAARIADAELRDQATRAAKSAFLDLAEGLPDDRVAMRRKYFLASDGSLHEVVAAVDLACALGALGSGDAAGILALAGRFRALLRGLLRAAAR